MSLEHSPDRADDELGGFTIPEFCKMWRFSRSFAYNEIKAGRLKVAKVGVGTRVTKQAARDYQRLHDEAKQD
jgi:hypothetical protein